MLLSLVSTLKYRLSHIRSNSWHWELVSVVWGSKAKGKACTYYWFKVPLSLLGFLIMYIMLLVFFLFRFVNVSLRWIFGYHLHVNIFTDDEDDPILLDGRYYYNYKQRPNGNKMRFAPWQFLMLLVVLRLGYFLIVESPRTGILLLFGIAVIFVLAVIVFFFTANWQHPKIVKARQKVINAWDQACPTLVIED